MTDTSTSAATGRPATPAARQTIDFRSTTYPDGGVAASWTERDVRVGGPAAEGTSSTPAPAITAARYFSAGPAAGIAVVLGRDGAYELRTARTYSHSYFSATPHSPFPPQTRLTGKSNVPFALGNLRFGTGQALVNVDDPNVVALVDGARVADVRTLYGGHRVLVERATSAQAR